MDSGGLEFWRTVWASILAGVAVVAIVAAASWLFGFHHAAWLWITSAASNIWAALTASVPVPAGMLIAFVIFVGMAVLVLWWVARTQVSGSAACGAQGAPEKPVPFGMGEPEPLTDNETAIIRLLARADGKWMTVTELARRAALANLVAEQTVDQLAARDFLEVVGDACCLNPPGRDYVIAKGYVPQPISAASRRMLR